MRDKKAIQRLWRKYKNNKKYLSKSLVMRACVSIEWTTQAQAGFLWKKKRERVKISI